MPVDFDPVSVYTCITLYGLARRQEKGQPALLLRRRERPRRRQAPHRSPNLSRHRRTRRRPRQGPHRPVPLSATTIEFGLPGALWLAAQNSGVFAVLESLWPAPAPVPPPPTTSCWPPFTASANPVPRPRSPIGIAAPSCTPSGASRRSASLRKRFGIASIRSSLADDRDRTDEADQLDQAQFRLLGVWKEKQLVSRRLLAYDTTNFYTYIASTNDAQRSGTARPQQAGPP